LPILWMGVGLSSGDVIAGHVGSTDRLEFTVIGAVVNKAHRLQALAGPGQVVMSDRLHERLTEPATRIETLGPTQLKGFREPTEVVAMQVCEHAA